MAMRLPILSLVVLAVLLSLVDYSSARVIDSCVALDSVNDVWRLQRELDKAGIPNRTDKKVLCVTQEHRESFYRIVGEVVLPKPLRSQKVPPSPSGIPLQSITLTDPDQQRLLQNELERQKIWYTTDETGALWHEVTKEKQVDELILNIIESDIPAGRSVHYAQPFSRELFKTELARHGVPYESKIRRNEEWIV